MKITWKIFFSSVLTMTVTFCVAGYFLISTFFESGYEQAVNSAIDLNRMFLRAFGNYMVNEEEGTEVQDAIGAIASDMLKEDVRIYIEDEKGNKIYADASFTGEEEEHTGWERDKKISFILIPEGNDYYIRINNGIQVGEVSYYAVTYHNVTNIFTERDSQIRIYNQFLIWLALANGVISWILARFIVGPIRNISQGAGRIAGGDLAYRLSIRNQDEIGAMAENFNKMADSLSGKIRELEDVAERQEEFIGSFAHELKTPLTSIIGYADLLRSNRQSEEEQFLCASYIFEEGRRLETLSLRLLELTVLGKNELKRKDIPVCVLLEDVKGIVMPLLAKESTELIIEAEEKELSVEPELVKSVLMNLIDNARKSMKSGGIIRIHGSIEEQGYMLQVTDNGRGIPKEEIERITDAFYMVDKSRSRKQGGAGLGLTICNKIMELHGGSIRFESELGKGTSVKLQFPVKQGKKE